MAIRHARATRGRRLVHAAAAAATGLAVGVPALMLLGALAPGLPVVSQAAHGSGYAGWLSVLAALGLAGAAARWWARRTTVRAVVVLLAAAACAGCVVVLDRLVDTAGAYGVPVDPLPLPQRIPAPDATVTYTTGDDGRPVRLSVSVPDPRPAGRAPVAVWLHGGGWVSSTRLAPVGLAHLERLHRRGWVVVHLDYSLSSATAHRWDTTEPQVACALAWLGRHAADYGADADRITLMGASAGGNLALDVAYRAAAGTLRPSCGGRLPVPAAVVVTSPIADPVGFHDNPDPVLGRLTRWMARAYTGGSPAEYPERYRAVTPVTHVTPQAPPTLVVVPDHDGAMPAAGARDLAAAARAAGVEVELVVVPYGAHVFDLPGTVGAQLVDALAARWITEHGAGPG
jgi:acetyl esterase/lipase